MIDSQQKPRVSVDASEDLKAKGAQFTRGPVTVRPGLRVAFMTGPDNVSIEILDRDAK